MSSLPSSLATHARPLRLLAVLAVILMQGACSSVPVPQAGRLPDVPPRHLISGLPLIPQADKYCGPAALATVLQYHGQDVPQQKAADMVYTPGREGTLQPDMLAALRRQGMLAVPVKTPDDMVREVAADLPVIAFQNLGLSWKPYWHYTVIAGYDLPAGEFIVHGGGDKPKRLSFHKLGATWARAGSWAYAVAPPGRLPVTAGPRDIAAGAAGLEQAGRVSEAETAYHALVKKYPDAPAGWFGLGNARMARKDHKGAEGAYRKALALDPAMAEAANNLAYALSAQARRGEACRLLRTESARHGPHQEAVSASRDELCGGR